MISQFTWCGSRLIDPLVLVSVQNLDKPVSEPDPWWCWQQHTICTRPWFSCCDHAARLRSASQSFAAPCWLPRPSSKGGKERVGKANSEMRPVPSRPVPSRDAPVDDGSEPVAPSGWSEGRHHQRSPVMLMQLGSGEKILDESIGNMRLKILDFNLR